MRMALFNFLLNLFFLFSPTSENEVCDDADVPAEKEVEHKGTEEKDILWCGNIKMHDQTTYKSNIYPVSTHTRTRTHTHTRLHISTAQSLTYHGTVCLLMKISKVVRWSQTFIYLSSPLSGKFRISRRRRLLGLKTCNENARFKHEISKSSFFHNTTNRCAETLSTSPRICPRKCSWAAA